MRAAILEAAMRLLEREGQEALTLSAVAGEAHIARATIYSYFSGRQELISQLPQVPADGAGQESVTETAPAEGENASASAEETEEAPVETAAAPAEPSPPAESAPAPEAPTEEAPSADAPAEADAETAPEPVGYERLMRAQAQALDEIAKRVIVPKSLKRDPAEIRLEARLSVAEKSLAGLERRVDEEAKALSGRCASLAERLQQLEARVRKSEDRLQAALAELRLDVHNLANAPDEAQAPSTVEAREPEPVVVDLPAESPEPVSEAAPEAPEHGRDYLNTARQAAINASQQVAAKKEPKRKSRLAMLKLRRKYWRWVLVAALVVAGFDGYVFTRFSDMPAAHASVVIRPAAPAPKRTLAGLAAAGDARAQLALGVKLLNGAGVQTNVEQAAIWLERAAAQGLPVAQNYMGVLYQTGTGVAANMAKAMRWYEASAEQGNLKAMSNLGKAYAGGWTDGTDFTKAAEWFGRAADQGDVDAEFDLAVLYERGEGVSRSIPDAYRWYAIAAAQGDANASTRAAILAAQLTPDELRTAEADVAAFKPLPVVRAANETPAPVRRN